MSPPARRTAPDASPPRLSLVAAGILVVVLFTVLIVRLSRELNRPSFHSLFQPTPSPSEVQAPTQFVHGTVVRVVDGDTVRIRLDTTEQEVTVRLIGVDTPETLKPNWPVECWGPEASVWTRTRAVGARGVLRQDPIGDDTDKYGRLIRYFTIDGERTSLNLQLIETGNAHAYTEYPFTESSTFVQAEQEAKAAGRGLWGEPCAGERGAVGPSAVDRST